MRIAVSGTYFTGKSTLIEDIIEKLPDWWHSLPGEWP